MASRLTKALEDLEELRTLFFRIHDESVPLFSSERLRDVHRQCEVAVHERVPRIKAALQASQPSDLEIKPTVKDAQKVLDALFTPTCFGAEGDFLVELDKHWETLRQVVEQAAGEK
jgi:hypothetical protein